jgi:hypothetical protein
MAIDATNNMYGGADYNGSRVIFVNGDIDPCEWCGDPRPVAAVSRVVALTLTLGLTLQGTHSPCRHSSNPARTSPRS